jgi:hypothetical protein
VDLGSGLGTVVLLAHLVTGARARGVEIQPKLVARARDAAIRLGLDATAVSFEHGDVRDAAIDDGTVFYMYAPFTGSVLVDVTERLHAIAKRRAVIVCALGIELDRRARWLVPREGDSFWLTIYDGDARRERAP